MGWNLLVDWRVSNATRGCTLRAAARVRRRSYRLAPECSPQERATPLKVRRPIPLRTRWEERQDGSAEWVSTKWARVRLPCSPSRGPPATRRAEGMQMKGRARNLPLRLAAGTGNPRWKRDGKKPLRTRWEEKRANGVEPFGRLAGQQRDPRMYSSRGSAGSPPVVPACP